MRHGKDLLGDKVRYTVEMLISAVHSQSPCGRQLPPRGASHVSLLTLNLNLLRKTNYKKSRGG